MEVFGISISVAAICLVLGGFLGVRFLAPRTEAKWDDKVLDQLEGLFTVMGVDPDEAAKKSFGKLKSQILKKVD